MVVCYDFVWYHERLKGQIEGAKYRPACIVVAVPEENGNFVVTYAPITTKEPALTTSAIELPEAEKRHLGLTAPRCWVVVHELNEEAWPHGLTPVKGASKGQEFLFGWLSPGFLRQILRLQLSISAKVIPRA